MRILKTVENLSWYKRSSSTVLLSKTIMSFNMNRLVQAECGGSNPLVAAAQQIAVRPSTSALASSKLRTRGTPVDFTKDFIQQQQQAQHQANTSLLQSLQIQPGISNSQQAYAQSCSNQDAGGYMVGNYMMRDNLLREHMIREQMKTLSQPTAGEQLEEKYRTDLISSSEATVAAKEVEVEVEKDIPKEDDLAFWQSLSQKFIGPTTTADKTDTQTTTTKTDDEFETLFPPLNPTPPDMEYIFDERNPLKDQFEDPFAEGLKRLEQGDIPSAALLFEAAVQNEPENSLAWRYLGTTQAQNEKDMSAIRALKNCLKLDSSEQQQARLAISVSLANETYHQESCKYLLEWLMNHDKYKSLGASLDEFHLLDGELSNDPFYMNSVSEKHYTYVRDKFIDAARLSPTNPDPEVQSSLGVLFNMRGEYQKAVDCFKAALSVKADDCLLWNRLGATLANGNKSEDAVIAYRKALEISPGFLRSRYNLAISLIHLNTYDEAAKQLVQILNMQAAGRGSKNTQIRTRSITSTSIWNTLRTVATLLNRPDLYPIIDGRNLAQCNEQIFRSSAAPSAAVASAEAAASAN